MGFSFWMVDVPLISGLALVILGSVVGATLSKRNSNWFMSLLQSKFTPPRSAFKVLWPVCYASLAVGFLLLRWFEPNSLRWDSALVYSFVAQSILNIFYPILFFHLKRLDWALWNITVLSVSSVLCTWHFYQSPAPWIALLLLPYTAWVIFLTVLTADFYRIKRGQETNPFLFKQNYSPHSLYVDPKAMIETGKFYSQVPRNPLEEQSQDTKKTL